MAEKYKKLTDFLPLIKADSFGKWIIDKKNDGSEEHPIQFPFVSYSDMVNKLCDEIYNFEREHQEYGMKSYGQILEEHHIEWGTEAMNKADVSQMDGKTVMAMLMGAVRAERFCNGALLDFLKKGAVRRWLERLYELDQE